MGKHRLDENGHRIYSNPCECHPNLSRGHSFSSRLVCACGRTWDEQQSEATDCQQAAAQTR